MTENKGRENPAPQGERDEEDDLYVTLEFENEDGSLEQIEYTVDNIIDAGEREYVVLLPVEQPDSIEVYRYREGEEDAEITEIEDEKEFSAVIARLRELGYRIELEN
ncbi:MAG: DUF1292 domain-containing protein [Anaerovoracaceae bacterium]|jgi:hypothetical protein